MDCWILVSDPNAFVDFAHGSVSVLSMMSSVAEWICLVHECDTQGFVFVCFVVFCFAFCFVVASPRGFAISFGV